MTVRNTESLCQDSLIGFASYSGCTPVYRIHLLGPCRWFPSEWHLRDFERTGTWQLCWHNKQPVYARKFAFLQTHYSVVISQEETKREILLSRLALFLFFSMAFQALCIASSYWNHFIEQAFSCAYSIRFASDSRSCLHFLSNTGHFLILKSCVLVQFVVPLRLGETYLTNTSSGVQFCLIACSIPEYDNISFEISEQRANFEWFRCFFSCKSRPDTNFSFVFTSR